jgi:hypothetical protein
VRTGFGGQPRILDGTAPFGAATSSERRDCCEDGRRMFIVCRRTSKLPVFWTTIIKVRRGRLR